MSDKVRFGGKEKCLIGVYFFATATSTILFTATLVIVLQSQGGARESENADINATGHTEQQVSNRNQEISTLNYKIEQIRSEFINRTNVAQKHKEDNATLSKKIRELQDEIYALRANDERRKNATETIEKNNVALRKEMSTLQTSINLIQAVNGDRSLCSMGVSYGGIVDNYQISASTEYRYRSSAEYAKAHFGRLNKRGNSWIASKSDYAPWIQVDFGEVKTIVGVMTQGSAYYKEWVTSYKLQCGDNAVDGTFFTNSSGAELYKGNSDQNTIVTHVFSSPKRCRYVRIYPQTHYGDDVSLRMEWITQCT